MSEDARIDIAPLIPHRGTMLMLESVGQVHEDGLTAFGRVPKEHPLLQDGQFGTWIGIEYMAQAVAAFAGLRERARGNAIGLGFLLGTRRFDCIADGFKVDDAIEVDIRREIESEDGMGAFQCVVRVNQRDAARAVITVFAPRDATAFLQQQARKR